jgi:hypothetical protein
VASCNWPDDQPLGCIRWQAHREALGFQPCFPSLSNIRLIFRLQNSIWAIQEFSSVKKYTLCSYCNSLRDRSNLKCWAYWTFPERLLFYKRIMLVETGFELTYGFLRLGSHPILVEPPIPPLALPIPAINLPNYRGPYARNSVQTLPCNLLNAESSKLTELRCCMTKFHYLQYLLTTASSPFNW